MGSKNKKSLPPRLGKRLLESFCSYDFLSTALWDLEELFNINVKTKGIRKAKLLYLKEAVSISMYLFFKGKSQHSTNKIAMFKHNILISLRSFKRYKSTFLINLIGLTSGIVCALFIYLWVADELKTDNFHQKGDNLYQVLQHNRWGEEVETKTYTPRQLASSWMAEFPEVELAISVNEDWAEGQGYVGIGEVKFKAHEYYADMDFFKAFSYDLIQGDLENPVPNTKSVMVSDQLAIKMFGELTDVVGQSVEWHQNEMSGNYMISGLFSIPKHSSKKFDLLFSESLLEERNENYNSWNNNNDATYLIMEQGADITAFNEKIEHYLKTKADYFKNTFSIQLFRDRYLHGTYSNAQVTGGRITYIWLFSVVGLFVLIIACINFMNLTTAKASNRLKEIGVKKAIGAKRKSLVLQYLTESLFLSFCASVLAVLVVMALLPEFNELAGKTLTFEWNSQLILSILGLTGLVGFLAGSYPAFYLSGFKPLNVLHGRSSRSSSATFIRKGLVIFQFSVTLVFIVAVTIISAQIDFIQAQKLGYDRENVVYFNNTGLTETTYSSFVDQISALPGVVSVSSADHDLTGMHGGTSYMSWPGKGSDNMVDFTNLEMGFGFIETMGIQVLEGRSYDKSRANEDQKIIFNETAIKSMGIEDPIGKTIKLWGKDRQIIGIVKDFHTESIHENISPTFILAFENLSKTLVRLQGETTTETILRIENLYKEFNAEIPFEFRFIDSDFQQMYLAEQRVSKLSKSFSAIAILISCLGLFGLAAFTAERRTKEIGIRKALGSGIWQIVRLLSADFTKTVLLAMVIGLPLGYIVIKRWIEGFAYHITLEWWYFALAGIITLAIAWLTVGLQTVKAARTNPIESLRSE